MFETYIIQPIFNLLLILYAAIGDFGVAIIVFTVLVRFLMWPLLRKQLHQGRVIRKIQPEIKEIRKRNKGDRQKESAELMELYKVNGVSPFGSFGLLLVQIPVFLGVFSALRSFIQNPERIISLPYNFVAQNQTVQDMFAAVADKTNQAINGLTDPQLQNALLERFNGTVTADDLTSMSKTELHELFTNTLVTTDANGTTQTLVQGPFFDQYLFGVIDLSGRAISDAGIYIPVMIIAILAGVFQFYQTRQLMPSDKNGKSVREIMKDAAKNGKEPDQSEISAAMNKRLGLFFAPLITLISATSPSGLALYFASSGLVGLLQQRRVLSEDVEEMELVADVVEDDEKKLAAQNKSAKKSKSSKKKSPNKKSKAKKKGR